MFKAICIAIGLSINPTAESECVRLVHTCEQIGLPPALCVAVGLVESRLQPSAISRSGNIGTLQILPRYHCEGAVKCDSVIAGTRYLKRLVESHGIRVALAHYNCGGRAHLPRCVRYSQRVRTIAHLLGPL